MARRSLWAVSTDCRTTFLTSPHPQLSVDMQFALVQTLHLVGFSCELTRISIGGPILRWMGRMGLVARRSLWAVSTACRTTFLTSLHLQLSVNMHFGLVQLLHLAGFSRKLTIISIGGAIMRWMGRMGLVDRRILYDACTD